MRIEVIKDFPFVVSLSNHNGQFAGQAPTMVNGRKWEGTMIVVANRVPIAKGYEQEFEKRFERRLGAVDQMSGFIRNEILRPIMSDYYVVMTYWESKEAFETWTQSESFRQAHANPAPKEMFAGRNVFEMHEVIQMSEKKP